MDILDSFNLECAFQAQTRVAQLVERVAFNHTVAGSSPAVRDYL